MSQTVDCGGIYTPSSWSSPCSMLAACCSIRFGQDNLSKSVLDSSSCLMTFINKIYKHLKNRKPAEPSIRKYQVLGFQTRSGETDLTALIGVAMQVFYVLLTRVSKGCYMYGNGCTRIKIFQKLSATGTIDIVSVFRCYPLSSVRIGHSETPHCLEEVRPEAPHNCHPTPLLVG